MRDAFIYPLSPPPIPELGNASGFNFRLQNRVGGGHDALIAARNQLLNVEQARALARVADAPRLPTVSVGISSSRTPGTNDSITNNYQAGFQISAYEQDLFGKIKRQSDAATARYLASAEGRRTRNCPGLTRQALAAREAEVSINRPYGLQAERQLMAANANIGAAKAASFPSNSLTTNLGTASSQLSDLFSNTAWSLALQVLLPIFDSGRNKANLASAKAAQGSARHCGGAVQEGAANCLS